MNNRVEEVTIVGGGTAGWLTALTLDGYVNGNAQGPRVKVTLIESPKIPIIGVGEATLASLKLLMKQLGINEAAFFKRCNASFKLSVRFDNWALDHTGAPKTFYHPFDYPPHLNGFIPPYYYKRFGAPEGVKDLADAMVPNTALVKAARGPRQLGQRIYSHDINYAYHLDATLFGQFLRDVALKRGIAHVLDDVVEVERDERGMIAALELEQRGRYPVEFVVDCTGFRGLLLQQAMGEPFVPFGDNLLCDRAIPVQLPHPDPNRIEPCTRSTALGAGWVWRVPLFNRVGTGYVFSSQFRSDDEAMAEFVQHIRAIGDLAPDAPDPELRVIPMRVGRVRRAWVGNCVAIGLAGGFIEPLESTAIAMTDAAGRWLAGLLPDKAMSPEFADSFNRKVERLYDEVREFIISQYVASNRTDPFWQAARNDITVPDRLAENLALWRHVLPDQSDTLGTSIFNNWNYLYTLWPKGYFEGCSFPLEGSTQPAPWEEFSRDLVAYKQKLIARLPDHVTLLRDIRGEPVAPSGTAGESPRVDYRPEVSYAPGVTAAGH